MSFHIVVSAVMKNGRKKVLKGLYHGENATMAYTIPTREELDALLEKIIAADEKLKTRPKHYIAGLYVSGMGEDGNICFAHEMPNLKSAFSVLKDACLLFQNIKRETLGV
jgi:hypothetical protein